MGEDLGFVESVGNMIDGIPIATLTAPALLGIAILMVLTGKLWTNAAMQREIQNSERWRLAYEAERDARLEADAQAKELLELAKTTHALISGVFTNSEYIRRLGEPDVLSKTW